MFVGIFCGLIALTFIWIGYILNKEYKERLFVDINTKERCRILNRCIINFNNKYYNGFVYIKEVANCNSSIVMREDEFYAKHIKLSEYEQQK